MIPGHVHGRGGPTRSTTPDGRRATRLRRRDTGRAHPRVGERPGHLRCALAIRSYLKVISSDAGNELGVDSNQLPFVAPSLPPGASLTVPLLEQQSLSVQSSTHSTHTCRGYFQKSEKRQVGKTSSESPPKFHHVTPRGEPLSAALSARSPPSAASPSARLAACLPV
jgi:hypothetical protein